MSRKSVLLRRAAVIAASATVIVAVGPLAGLALAAPTPAANGLSPADGATVQSPATVSICYAASVSTPPTSLITVTKDGEPTPTLGSTAISSCNSGSNNKLVWTPQEPLEDEGLYDVSATAFDALPGGLPEETNWSFTIDSTAPSVVDQLTLTNPVNDGNKAAVELRGHTDPATSVSYVIANTPTPGATRTGSTTSHATTGMFEFTGIDVSTLADGAIRATVTATDAAGNTSSATVDSVKDTVAPARTATTPANASTTKTRSTVIVTFDQVLDTTAGSTVAVKNGNNFTVAPTGVAFSDGDTTMTFTAQSAFTEAGSPYSVIATAKDLNGNTSTTTTTFTVDDTAPAAPTVFLTDPVNLANQNTAIVSGVAEPGSTVNVSVDDETVGSPYTESGPAHATTGAYSIEVDLESLADGDVVASATATDPAGNTGTAGTSAASTKDTVAPAAPSVSMTDPVNEDNQDTVVVSGVAAPGSAISISVNDTDNATSAVTDTTTADGTTGAYTKTVDVTSLSDGTITASVVATDAAGNPSSAGTDTATLDSGDPAMPTLTIPTVNGANEGSVPVSGTAEPGSTVTVALTDGQASASTTTTAGNDGAYSTTLPATDLADGTLTGSAKATDAAGNESPVRTISVAKDTDAPAAPVLTMPSYVNDTTKGAVEMSGTGEAGVTVNLTFADTDGGTANVTDSVVVAPNGTWTKTVPLTSLSDGTITGTASATDTAGNTSTGTGTDTAVKDVVTPAAPTVSLTDPIDGTNVATATVSGSAENGSTVDVSVDDTDGTTSPVTGSDVSDGTYSVQLDLGGLKDGTLTATATATDAAGNVSAPATDTAAKDTTALALVSTSPADASVVQSAATITATYNEPLHATQSTIVVKDDTASPLAGTTTFTDGGKTIVFTPTDTLTDAGTPYSVTLAAKDSDGTDSLPGGFTFAIDSTPPAAPSVSIPEVVNDANDDATPISGVAEPGSTVSLSVDDATPGSPVTDTVTADGTTGAYSKSLNLSSLADGAITVTATATDAVGNTSAPATDTATKDATVPAMPTVNLPTYVNAANDDAVAVTGTAEPGSTVSVSVDDATPGSPVTDSVVAHATTGAYSTSLNLTSLADGTATATATATDAAGNTSGNTTDTATKDTVIATPTVSMTDPVNAANTTTVTVSGTAEPGSTVSISVDDATPGSPKVDTKTAGNDGAYSATFDVTTLADGTLTASATATDVAGNVSGTATDTAVKDSSTPAVPTLGTPAEVTHATYQAAPFSGTAEPGSTVTITVDDTDNTTSAVSGTTTAANDGTWTKSLDLSSLKDGTLSVKVTATDAVSNTSGETTGSVLKNVERAFTLAISGTPVSGAAQEFTVTAHQTYSPASGTDTTFTGTPVLTSTDTHFTAGTCGAAVAGVSTCSGVVLGDLGAQTVTATAGSGDDLVSGSKNVVVQAVSLVFTVAPPARVTNPGTVFTFKVAPTAGVTGASTAGYSATRTLVTTGGSTPNTGTALTCAAAECEVSMSFLTRGPKTVKVTDNGTPSLSTPTANVTVPYGTETTLFRTASTVPSGSPVILYGDVWNTTKLEGVAGVPVKIYRKVAPATTYSYLGTVTTDEDGIWAVAVRVTRNTAFQARYAGNTTHLASNSRAAVVKASQVVTAGWTRSGRTVTVGGRVSPNASGKTVYLQYKKSDGTWAYAGAKATVRSDGTYKMSKTFRPGTYVVRVAIAATTLNAAGYSKTKGLSIT